MFALIANKSLLSSRVSSYTPSADVSIGYLKQNKALSVSVAEVWGSRTKRWTIFFTAPAVKKWSAKRWLKKYEY